MSSISRSPQKTTFALTQHISEKWFTHLKIMVTKKNWDVVVHESGQDSVGSLSTFACRTIG